MVDDWVAGGIIAAVVVIAVAAVAVMTNAIALPANPYVLSPNPEDQQFRAAQFVPDQAVLTNHEVISWTDNQGRQRTITVEREVK